MSTRVLPELRLIDELIDPIDGPSATRARALVDHFGSLHGFVTARRSELVSAGLSRAAARHVIGCRRLASVLVRRRRALRVRDARTAVKMVPHLAWHPVEEVWVISLDATQRALACTLVARGKSSSCAIATNEVFGPGLRHRARSVFVLHNHPSGDPTPSAADRDFTRLLGDAARLLGIDLNDHVVVAGGRFESIVTRRKGRVAPRVGDSGQVSRSRDSGGPRRRFSAESAAAPTLDVRCR